MKTNLDPGIDGYKSLLIEEEGGQAIELVSEENGILISMLLRQYFMSLRVLDRWAHLGPHMAQHWQKTAVQCQPTLAPTTTTPSSAPETKKTTKSSWDHFQPATMRARRASVGPLSERETDVEGESPPPGLEGINEEGYSSGEEERELAVMRKVFRRWCRRAGVHASAEGELGEDEVDCDWTRAIAPKVEGRIVMLGEAPGKSV